MAAVQCRRGARRVGGTVQIVVAGFERAIIHCVVDVAAPRRSTTSILLLKAHQRATERETTPIRRRSYTHLCNGAITALTLHPKDAHVFTNFRS